MIAPVIHWYFKQRSKELQDNLQMSIIRQEELFQELIFNLSKTEYGESYSIDGSESYQQFVSKIPVVQYEEIQPWIERNLKGEQGLLWPGDITWFAKSSGTTNSVSKFIPISYESMEYNHYTGNREVLTQFTTLYPNSNIFEGKGLLIGGSQSISGMSSDTFTGDLSAILMNHAPSWVNWKSTPDKDIAMMTNWEEKVDAIAHTTLKENVTSISGVPTWTLVLFKRILEITGKKHIHEVWPNLELFIHG
ncbi:MAG: GH3 auxin-responsive promoter family protein, partial [Sediminibacterium sp.]|nr:GH3 auxin-responsive promoter family protein [Sediminibacterium sp.]